MPKPEQHWYLTVSRGTHITTAGTVHKSLTAKLLLSRYIACQVVTALRVLGVDVSGIAVAVVRDGETQAEDKF